MASFTSTGIAIPTAPQTLSIPSCIAPLLFRVIVFHEDRRSINIKVKNSNTPRLNSDTCPNHHPIVCTDHRSSADRDTRLGCLVITIIVITLMDAAAAPPLAERKEKKKRRGKRQLDSSTIPKDAVYCVDCDQVYLGRTHGSRTKHKCVPVAMEKWQQHCIMHAAAARPLADRNEKRKRRRRCQLDSSTIAPGAVYCAQCEKVYLDKTHESRAQHYCAPVTMAQWQQHCNADEAEYRFDFGKCKGLSLEETQNIRPAYIAWIIREGLYNYRKHHRLRRALIKGGFLKQVNDSGTYSASHLVTEPKKRKRLNWRRKFGPPKETHRCSICRSSEHNKTSCVAGCPDLHARVVYKTQEVARRARKLLYSGKRR